MKKIVSLLALLICNHFSQAQDFSVYKKEFFIMNDPKADNAYGIVLGESHCK